jgi:hypothetical protein
VSHMTRAARSGAIALLILVVPGATLLVLVLASLMFVALFAAELWQHGNLARAWREAVGLIMPGRWN